MNRPFCPQCGFQMDPSESGWVCFSGCDVKIRPYTPEYPRPGTVEPQEDCPHCEGVGESQDSDGKWQVCVECAGTGYKIKEQGQ